MFCFIAVDPITTFISKKTQAKESKINPISFKKNLGEKYPSKFTNFKHISSKFFKNLEKSTKTSLEVFGPGGGFLGVGTSELVVIGIVAWLVLGPKRLYQLARDIGRISGEIKNVADEARQTFQQAIDLESTDLSEFSPKKDSGKMVVQKKSDQPRIKNLDEMVNDEISGLEKKK
mmetsp:Transcript_46950/g.96002  ORF Transcript_46950/g.96002 Transcript_46950/m.96002 type:complete len:175 (+) Transcript_46950:41-565(+)